MAISLYSGFVPVCLQLLGGLKTVLQKAEEHATAQKWETAVVLNLRLYPDMFTLERQVRQRYGRLLPMTVLLLQDEAYVNGNNLTYDAYLRRDPFTFITLDYPVSRAQLLSSLEYASAFACEVGQAGDVNLAQSPRLKPAFRGLDKTRCVPRA